MICILITSFSWLPFCPKYWVGSTSVKAGNTASYTASYYKFPPGRSHGYQDSRLAAGQLCLGRRCQRAPCLQAGAQGWDECLSSFLFPSWSATAQKASCSWGRWAPRPFCLTPNALSTTGRAGHRPWRSAKMSWGQHRGSGISHRYRIAQGAMQRAAGEK